MKVKCSICKKAIERKQNDIKRYENVYCSLNCRNKGFKTGFFVNCETCNKKLYRTKSQFKKSKSKKFFCNKSCSVIYNNKNRKINPNDLKSYRDKALTLKEAKCERCGFNEFPKILHVHHKDHNRDNNIDNLEVLCPNCHAIEHIEIYKCNNNKP